MKRRYYDGENKEAPTEKGLKEVNITTMKERIASTEDSLVKPLVYFKNEDRHKACI
jgi:hypothetical protein